MTPVSLTLFLMLSALAVIASLHSWRTRQVYGFFRFLSFETLAVLVAWNSVGWFNDPFSTRQIASWILLMMATLLAAHGIFLLRTIGGARKRVIEETQILVERGIYRYIRHPLYASLMFFSWGVCLKGFDVISGVLTLGVTVFLTLTGQHEERLNRKIFGAAYSEYMKRTKMFIPYIF